jgi:hypothetical protein
MPRFTIFYLEARKKIVSSIMDIDTFDIFDLFGEEIYCSICLETVKEGERTMVVQKCKHGFHHKCLDSWLKNKDSCPNCRSVVQIEISEMDRVLISWMLCDWILQTYPNKLTFYAKKNNLRTFIQGFRWNNVRPFPIDMASLSSLRRMKAQLKEKQRELAVPSPLQSLTIRRNARLHEISEQVAAQLQQFSQQ